MTSLYDEIFTYANLYKAHCDARKGKRHKHDVIEYELNLGANIALLYERLMKRTYCISGYHRFIIYEPKKREIQSLKYEDRIVQHCLVDNYLAPLLERHLIFDNAACRKGKGTSFVRQRMKKMLHDYALKHGHQGYVLQYDIHQYFQEIDHSLLKIKLQRMVKDEELLLFLFMIIDSYNKDANKGLPMGNQTSQCFALLYLDNIDRLIKEKYRHKYYLRYMDDGIVIGESFDDLRCLLPVIANELKHLRLSLNPKSGVHCLTKGIKFIGTKYHLYAHNAVRCTLSCETKKRIRLNLKTKEAKDRPNSLASYKGLFYQHNARWWHSALLRQYVKKENN